MILKKIASFKISPLNFIILAIFIILFIFSIYKEAKAEIIFQQTDGSQQVFFTSIYADGPIQFSSSVPTSTDILVSDLEVQCTNTTWKSFLQNPARFDITPAPNSGSIRFSGTANTDLAIDGNVSQEFTFILPTSEAGGVLNTGTDYYLWFMGNGNGECWLKGDSNGIPKITIETSDIGSLETRIIDFNPQNGTTTSSPVNFDIHAYINENDLESIRGVNITLHNIDQNVLLLGSFSNNDIVLLSGEVQDPGDFYFSTTTTLADGNYRLEACIERSYFSGWIVNPLSPISDCQSHQFIVGEPTFIGNISQTIYGETNEFFEGLNATSSEALASTCNPLNANFGIRECSAYLFIPDGYMLQSTLDNARFGILSRVPWGYATRFITVLSSSATSSLPSFTASIQIGPGNDETPEITDVSFDMGDMITGGGTLVDSIEDPINGNTFRDVFYPIIQITVAILVLLTIVSDVMGSHKHNDNGAQNNKKL